MTTNIDFTEWLTNELTVKGWDQAELSRRSGITTAHISRIMTGQRHPGTEALSGIAHALRLPAEDLFRRAGLLPMPVSATTDDRRLMQDLVRKLEKMNADDRRYAAELLDRVFPNVQK